MCCRYFRIGYTFDRLQLLFKPRRANVYFGENKLAKDYFKTVEKFTQIVASRGKRYILLIQPDYYKIFFPDSSPNGISYGRYLTNLKRLLLDANIEFYDTNEDILVADRAIFTDSVHFNRAGNKRIADIMNQMIAKR